MSSIPLHSSVRFRTDNWRDLPEDLLERIFEFCIPPDQIRMQSVCKSWQSILKIRIRRQLPLLLMPPKDKQEEEEEESDTRNFFSLSQQRIHAVHLPEVRRKRCYASFKNGWMLFVDKRKNLSLFHPWSRKKLQLPHKFNFKYRVEDFRAAAVSDDGNVVVVVYRPGHLEICRIGDKAWSHVQTCMADVVYHKGKFYALDRWGFAYLLSIESGFRPVLKRLTYGLSPSPSGILYLVPDILTDSMFVINRRLNFTDMEDYDHVPLEAIHFNIYDTHLGEGAPNEELKEFTKVESLGDRVLFLGYNSPLIVTASKIPGLKGNRIYFTDNGEEGSSCSLGVFNVEDGTVEEPFAGRFQPTSMPPIWVASPPYS